MSIVDAIPREWGQVIRQSTQRLPSHNGDTTYLKMGNSEVALSKVSSKLLYDAFKSKKERFHQLLRLRRIFHSFRLTGRKYNPSLLQSRLKLK